MERAITESMGHYEHMFSKLPSNVTDGWNWRYDGDMGEGEQYRIEAPNTSRLQDYILEHSNITAPELRDLHRKYKYDRMYDKERNWENRIYLEILMKVCFKSIWYDGEWIKI